MAADDSAARPDDTVAPTRGLVPPPPGFAARTELLAGRYELAEQIGAGGMGVVRQARDTMFGRDVAVKLLRPDVPADSPAATRFHTEATITGRLQHPGIPPAYELGTLSNGQPFLAMKLVKGQTLRQLLMERQSPADGLGRFIAVFEQVCHAVGYAHAHDVIHRDLKPSNVMVGAHGEVQVMDWGLAKVLTASRDHEGAAVTDPEATQTWRTQIATPQPADSETRTGSVLGTPAYMPPEQAGGEVRKLDARSDVFGLGAILCEILTGEPPYRGQEENELRLQAVRWETGPAFARLEACQAEPELVALCKRCLAYKQEDRPADGRAVAQQVAEIRQAAEARARQAELEQQRALVREAEGRKRRRVVQWAAAAVAAVLVAGLGASLWQMRRAMTAEALANKYAAEAVAERDAKAQALQAEAQARQLAEQQKLEAETNLGYARKANQILGSVFTGLDPKAEYQTLAEFRNALAANLTHAAEQLEGSAIGDPLVVAEMQNTLGRSLLGLGEAPLAITLFERAFATQKARLGPEHPDTLTSMNNLALAYQAAGRLDEALPLYEQAAAGVEKRGFRHEHAGGILGNTINAYEAARQFERAEAWRRKWAAHVKETAGADSLPYAGELAALGLKLLQQKKYGVAEGVLRECLAIREEQQPEAWSTFNAQSMLGEALLGQEKHAEAEPLLLAAYEGLKARQEEIPPPVRVQRLVEAVDRLIALHTALNRPEDVQRWQAEKSRL
ncbi:MAG: serine/threonine-protein kinase, partial [Pirellulales bacterium]|nr:serine/threonine-protein kinase [Pirellulales bacterium]